MFDFDVARYRSVYQDQGWLHIKGGATDELCEAVRRSVSDAAEQARLAGKGIAGAKDQLLFDLPAGLDYRRELLDVVASLCGLRPEGMTLSERHIKLYSPDADPWPTPHKDRLASQVAVGVSVEIPEGSHLVIYPFDRREANPFLTTDLRGSLDQDQLPEAQVRDATPVEIFDRPGDVVIFPGSSLWHLRRNSAGTINLYLKFNDFDCDPLGEDLATPIRRADTVALLGGDRAALSSAKPRLARRLESVRREWNRANWGERLLACVWDQAPFPISDAEFAILRAVDLQSTVADLAESNHDVTTEAALDAIRRLARRGALDLIRSSAR